LKSVVKGTRKSSSYQCAQRSDSDWEAEVLPLNYTRQVSGQAAWRIILRHRQASQGRRTEKASVQVKSPIHCFAASGRQARGGAGAVPQPGFSAAGYCRRCSKPGGMDVAGAKQPKALQRKPQKWAIRTVSRVVSIPPSATLQ